MTYKLLLLGATKARIFLIIVMNL